MCIYIFEKGSGNSFFFISSVFNCDYIEGATGGYSHFPLPGVGLICARCVRECEGVREREGA